MNDYLDNYEAQIPNLVSHGYRVTSCADIHYNCVSWAAGENHRQWWPHVVEGDVTHWPDGVPHEETVEAFTQAFETLDYKRGVHIGSPTEIERVVIFVSERTGLATHAARQLEDGSWTSKLGEAGIDIEHDNVDAVSGNEWWFSYGSVAQELWRDRPRPNVTKQSLDAADADPSSDNVPNA